MIRPLIAGNWKMHKTIAEATALVEQLCVEEPAFPASVDIMVAPPFTAIAAISDVLLGGNHPSRIMLGAQTMHDETHGAFTGEISAAMLRELGVRYVIIGHSERRMYANETDAAVARKVRAALGNELTPIVCVGETLAEHEAGKTIERVTAQTQMAFEDLSPEAVARCVVAYEPIWAIGTGRSDDPANASAVMRAIRGAVDGLAASPILYGGSVKPDNISAFMEKSDINGALVGGASLSATTFAEIIRRSNCASAAR